MRAGALCPGPTPGAFLHFNGVPVMGAALTLLFLGFCFWIAGPLGFLIGILILIAASYGCE
jgi:hypothetical protein